MNVCIQNTLMLRIEHQVYNFTLSLGYTCIGILICVCRDGLDGRWVTERIEQQIWITNFYPAGNDDLVLIHARFIVCKVLSVVGVNDSVFVR